MDHDFKILIVISLNILLFPLFHSMPEQFQSLLILWTSFIELSILFLAWEIETPNWNILAPPLAPASWNVFAMVLSFIELMFGFVAPEFIKSFLEFSVQDNICFPGCSILLLWVSYFWNILLPCFWVSFWGSHWVVLAEYSFYLLNLCCSLSKGESTAGLVVVGAQEMVKEADHVITQC